MGVFRIQSDFEPHQVAVGVWQEAMPVNEALTRHCMLRGSYGRTKVDDGLKQIWSR